MRTGMNGNQSRSKWSTNSIIVEIETGLLPSLIFLITGERTEKEKRFKTRITKDRRLL